MKTLFNIHRNLPPVAYLTAIVAFFMRLGYFMSLPFLAIFLARENLLSPSEIGIVLGASGLFFSTTGLINGLYVDRHSQKTTLIIALFASGLGYIGIAFSTKFFIVLFLLNASLGWLRSLADVSAVTLMIKSTEAQSISYAYSLRFIAMNLGVVIGPVIGASLANQKTLIIFIIAGVIYILLALILLFVPIQAASVATEKKEMKLLENISLLYQDKILMNIIFIEFLLWITYSQIDTTVALFLTQITSHPALLMGVLLIVNAILCISLQPFVMRWAEIYSLKWSSFFGTFLYTISFLIIAFYPTPATMIAAMALITIGELLTLPINSVIIARIAPKHLIASYSGLGTFGMIGMSLGPILGGYGLQYVGSKWTFFLMSLLPLLAAGLYFKNFPD